MTLLMIALGALLLYLLQMRLFRRYWNEKLYVEISFPKEPAFEEDTAVLSEVITNQKAFPLPTLQVKFQIDRNLEFLNRSNVGVSDKAYKNDVFSLLFYQRITRTIPFRCSRRGYYEINRVDLVASDLTLSGNLVEDRRLHTSFYVYPKPIDASDVDLFFRRISGSVITKRATIEDPFEFRSIRDYSIQDPLKSINWKASARTGDLKVNVNEFTAGQEVRMLINLEDMTNWMEYRLLEMSIRMAASLGLRLQSANVPVGMTSNGFDRNTSSADVPVATGTLQQSRILQYLARLEYRSGVSAFAQLADQESGAYGQSTCFVVISYSTHEDTVDAIARLAAKHPGVFWILPYHSGKPYDAPVISDVTVMPWEVKSDD